MITQEIREFKEYLEKNNIKGLALDIDETLCDTSTYWFEEAVKKFGNPTTLTTKEIIDKYILIQNIPFWDKEILKPWIINARKSKDMHVNANSIENAIEIVNQIHQNIPIVAYITARSETLRGITKLWLKKHKFPKAKVFHVISQKKDLGSKTSSKAKVELLEYLYPHITGIVDDHPDVAELTHDKYEGNIYVFRSTKVYDKKNIISCKDWNDVFEKIK
jgi:uncharacterized HAD superfamily protein